MGELSEQACKRWMRQWKSTVRQLPELKYKGLRELTPERLLARIDAVLALSDDPAYRDPGRRTTSGPVQRQALLEKLRKP